MDALQHMVHEHAGVFFERQLRLEEVVGEKTPVFNEDLGRMEYGDDLAFKAQVLAIEEDGSWRWAWSSDELPSDLIQCAKIVQSRGVGKGVDLLLDAQLPLANLDTQALAIVSVGVCNADGYVIAKGSFGKGFFLIKDLEFPRKPADGKRMLYVFDQAVREQRLESQRQAYMAYLTHNNVTHHIEDDEVIGLTIDGQLMRASFDAGQRLMKTHLDVEPPAAGFPCDRLDWRSDDRGAILTLTSVDASVLGRLITSRSSHRKPFSLRGPRGRSLVVQPGRFAFEAGEQQFLLQIEPHDAAAVRSVLRPGCGEYAAPSLPGLTIQVTEFEVLDAQGNVVRTIGWDPLPDPSWAIDPAQVAAEEAERRRRAARRRSCRKRGLACGLLALLIGFWPAFYAFAAFKLRHVPYTIPEAYQAPKASGLPVATGTGLQLRYLGISGYEITDGTTVILLDPQLTRPGLNELLSGPLEVDTSLHGEFRRADYILINHAHHDHALDMPALAERTGATVIGSQSAVNLAISRGLPAERTRVAVPGERLQLGTFVVDVRETEHSPVLGIENPMAGTIPADAGPLWFNEYTNDGTRFYRLEANGTSVWWHVSSSFVPGEYDLTAGTLIMGVAGAPTTAEKVRALMRDVQPARVLPTHYDNFFQPRSLGLGELPSIDLDEVCATIQAEAGEDVPVILLDYDQRLDLPAD